MRRVILFSLVALAALAGGAYALAGSPSQGMKAFALVDPTADRLASWMRIRTALSA
jgi:hypothetical protein